MTVDKALRSNGPGSLRNRKIHYAISCFESACSRQIVNELPNEKKGHRIHPVHTTRDWFLVTCGHCLKERYT